MTKREAVENHRKMWRWIALETWKRKKKVEKDDYFLRNARLYGVEFFNSAFVANMLWKYLITAQLVR